ncbi:MAG: secretion protein [Flavobacteriaceae bacterium]|nr:secretion protein [Flavobacteriaceae bacterium]|tara:strand:- start:33271 stop:34278 length:1008 start_codon:yes stop_codon:yes gene_type:complete
MKKIYLFALVGLLTITGYSQDTFSIIAVDPATGEIGSAGASCVTGVGSQGIIDIITKILPGRGGVNSQAYVCIPNTNLNNAIDQMEMGASPSEIIDYLIANDACAAQSFDPEFRQYGIADFDEMGMPRTAGFTGNMADDYKEDRQGATFSVQGNILLNQTVIDNMEDNFNTTTGALADKLMAALQGANFAGADARCLAAGTSSTTAYLLVYKADDDPNDPYIRLNVGQQASGVEPIDLLQMQYDAFLSVNEANLKSKLSLYPNPVATTLQITSDSSIVLNGLQVYDIQGKMVLSKAEFSSGNGNHTVDLGHLKSGVYFAKFNTNQGATTFRFVKK